MEEWYDLWFCSLPGVGNIRGERLLSLCGGSTKKLYHEPDGVWRQVLSEKVYEEVRKFTARWKLREEYEKMAEMGVGLVLLSQDAYPEKLKQIPDAPLGLFFKGRLPDKGEHSVAVVGARDCSAYGRYVAGALGKALGERGISLVSGMAKGIDGISQQAALEAGGLSYGVLGCGADICYPAGNRKLYEMLSEKGGVLSPYPPGTLPKSCNFPPRNRIVSGLSEAVVVIEARNKSGTLITVDMALEQGREVYVVPGRVTDRLSDGCNRLLKQGAQVFLSPEEFVEELFGSMVRKEKMTNGHLERENAGNVPSERQLPESLARVYEALDFMPCSLEKIGGRIPFSCTVGELGGMLIQLCMKDMAVQVSPGYFCRK